MLIGLIVTVQASHMCDRQTDRQRHSRYVMLVMTLFRFKLFVRRFRCTGINSFISTMTRGVVRGGTWVNAPSLVCKTFVSAEKCNAWYTHAIKWRH